MQTQTLPIQVSGASANATPQRANASQNADAAQFSQALSREMEQRHSNQAPASQPAPAKPQAAPQAQAAQAPAQSQAPAKPAADAKPADAKPADAKPATDSADEAKNDAADAAAAGPVADMLALVASFNQPAVAAAPAGAAAPAVAPDAAVQGADLTAYAGQPADAAALAGAAKATAPAGDDKGASFKDVAQTVDGAARLALNALAGAGARESGAKTAEPAAPKSLPAAENTPRSAASTDKPAALPGAAGVQDGEGAAAGKAGARAEPALAAAAPQAEMAPLRARETVADVAALKDAPAAAPLMAPVQQASVAMAQAVTGAPADRIAARVGTPGWDNQVGQKIVWMVAGKEQSASLTLNPPDMGPMQVVLNVTNDQATVTFSASQPEVRQALENAMPKLREMMSESGIALGNATVNAGMPDQRQAQQGEQPRSHGSGARFGGTGADTAPIAAATPRQSRTNGGIGLVDTFA